MDSEGDIGTCESCGEEEVFLEEFKGKRQCFPCSEGHKIDAAYEHHWDLKLLRMHEEEG